MQDMKETISLEEFRENAAEVLETLGERVGPLVLTCNGKRVAVMVEYEDFQHGEGLLLALLLKERLQEAREGKTQPAEEVFAEVRQRILDGTCDTESD